MSVYFIYAPEIERVKIGFSGNALKRFEQVKHWVPVSIVLLGTVDGPRFLETQLHQLCADHQANGEWFHMSPFVRDVIDQLLAGSFDREALPKKARAAWSRQRQIEGKMAPNGRPYRVAA